MDIYTKLVLVKNSKTKKFEDKTGEINYLKYLQDKIEVKGKTEVYHKSKVAYENSCLIPSKLKQFLNTLGNYHHIQVLLKMEELHYLIYIKR